MRGLPLFRSRHLRSRLEDPPVFSACGDGVLLGVNLWRFYFAIRYRQRSEHELPHEIHGSPARSLWSVIPSA
jgi:heme/copper-type cytochrome/quinol oxidase subunit 2